MSQRSLKKWRKELKRKAIRRSQKIGQIRQKKWLKQQRTDFMANRKAQLMRRETEKDYVNELTSEVQIEEAKKTSLR